VRLAPVFQGESQRGPQAWARLPAGHVARIGLVLPRGAATGLGLWEPDGGRTARRPWARSPGGAPAPIGAVMHLTSPPGFQGPPRGRPPCGPGAWGSATLAAWRARDSGRSGPGAVAAGLIGLPSNAMTDPTETPPRLCAWCGDPVPEQKGAGRRRDYCRRACRQRAYEERRTQDRIEERERLARIAVLAEVATKPSRDEMPVTLIPTRDELRELPPALPPRRGSRRRSGMTAAAMPLWRDQGEPDAPPR
jgi:hypothetical protein